MLVVAFGISYWLAGKNIEPIKKMYSRLQQFTADASHEMRTPLAVTRLAVESIRADEDSKLSENSNDALGMIDNENRRMTNLTDSLMSLARDDSGTFVMDMGKVNISDLCQKVANNLSLVAFDRNIDLKTQIDSDLVVNGNENALEHLLVILLDNSFKYSDADITLKLDSKRLKGDLLNEYSIHTLVSLNKVCDKNKTITILIINTNILMLNKNSYNISYCILKF